MYNVECVYDKYFFVTQILSYKVIMQYVKISNIVDTSIKVDDTPNGRLTRKD